MDRAEHAQKRMGRITGSVADVVYRGSDAAWRTLIEKLWLDDGSDFAGPSTGARAHGQRMEDVAVGMFWERHPELELDDPKFCDYHAPAHPWAPYLGVSPDRTIVEADRLRDVMIVRPVAGVEAKNPVVRAVYDSYARQCAAGCVPREHECQMRFGMWCLDVPGWWFVAQHGGDYTELWVPRCYRWENQWDARLYAFMAQYLENATPLRDKIGANLLDDI